MNSLPVDPGRAIPRSPKALSESDLSEAIRDSSPLSTWLPFDTAVRDFAPKPAASSSKPPVVLPRNSQLTLHVRMASTPNAASRTQKSGSQSPKLEDLPDLTALLSPTDSPLDLSPAHCGRHPVPWTMPDSSTLLKILHPFLVRKIQESSYHQDFPERCFCSLVLHELQKLSASTPLDVTGPKHHRHLQMQLRSILTENDVAAKKVLSLYGDALKLRRHARLNARPLRMDSWAEIIGLLCEDLFTNGPHPIFDDIDAAPQTTPNAEPRAEHPADGDEEGDDDDDDDSIVREAGGRPVSRRMRRLQKLKYKGSKRVFRSRRTRWDFTS